MFQSLETRSKWWTFKALYSSDSVCPTFKSQVSATQVVFCATVKWLWKRDQTFKLNCSSMAVEHQYMIDHHHPGVRSIRDRMGREWAIWNGTLGEEWNSDLQLTLQLAPSPALSTTPIIEEEFIKAKIPYDWFAILHLMKYECKCNCYNCQHLQRFWGVLQLGHTSISVHCSRPDIWPAGQEAFDSADSVEV